MHRRVRWENVMRVAGATLLVAVVVAWPRLAPPEPRLPAREAAPLAGDEPPVEPAMPRPAVRKPAPDEARSRALTGGRPGAKRGRTERSRPGTKRGRSDRSRSGTKRGRTERSRPGTKGRTRARRDESKVRRGGPPANEGRPGAHGGGPTNGGGPATNGAGTAPVAAPPPLPPDPAQTEFGFEGG